MMQPIEIGKPPFVIGSYSAALAALFAKGVRYSTVIDVGCADGSFFRGVFKLTNADGDTIRGRYFGHLEPTFNSTFPPPAPGGPWIIHGNVCISGGSAGDIDNDCSANHYEPARGITNLSNGDATIFLDQTIGID